MRAIPFVLWGGVMVVGGRGHADIVVAVYAALLLLMMWRLWKLARGRRDIVHLPASAPH